MRCDRMQGKDLAAVDSSNLVHKHVLRNDRRVANLEIVLRFSPCRSRASQGIVRHDGRMGGPRTFSRVRHTNGARMQQQIWSRAVTAGQNDSTHNIVRIVLPALNDMMDVTTSRAIALDTHLPALIFLLLICVALLSALRAGHVMAKRKHRSALHMILYAAIISVTIYAVLDLDEPRSG